jgi:2'-phosphotransferase
VAQTIKSGIRIPREAEGGARVRMTAYSEEDRSMSKRLSQLLRHTAAMEGLAMRDDGYVLVKDIERLRRPWGDPAVPGLTNAKLIWLVENNNKQRFSITQDDRQNLWVRANQGHSGSTGSVVDDAALLDEITAAEELSPAKFIVHFTTWDAWEQIRAGGLKPMERNHLHFTCHHKQIRGPAAANIAIYLDIAYILERKLTLFKSSNGLVLTRGAHGSLAPEFFARVEQLYPFEILWQRDGKESQGYWHPWQYTEHMAPQWWRRSGDSAGYSSENDNPDWVKSSPEGENKWKDLSDFQWQHWKWDWGKDSQWSRAAWEEIREPTPTHTCGPTHLPLTTYREDDSSDNRPASLPAQARGLPHTAASHGARKDLLGRAMTAILRHNHEGLRMDRHGYVLIKDVIAAIRNVPANQEMVWRTVETSLKGDKRRFQLDDGGEYIRATER